MKSAAQKGFAQVIIVLALAMIGISAFYGFRYLKDVAITNNKAVSLPSSQPASTSAQENPSDNLTIGIVAKTYKSSNLKIQFQYPSDISVEEVGNKIFLNGKTGQYVEVLQKAKDDSLTKAIEKQVLANYSTKDCLIKTASSGAGSPEGFEVASISLQEFPVSDETLKKCPSSYLAFGGINYFLYQSTHPAVFLHLSIGQYGIMVQATRDSEEVPWQKTIKLND